MSRGNDAVKAYGVCPYDGFRGDDDVVLSDMTGIDGMVYDFVGERICFAACHQ